jgi:hypothetical protein
MADRLKGRGTAMTGKTGRLPRRTSLGAYLGGEEAAAAEYAYQRLQEALRDRFRFLAATYVSGTTMPVQPMTSNRTGPTKTSAVCFETILRVTQAQHRNTRV